MTINPYMLAIGLVTDLVSSALSSKPTSSFQTELQEQSVKMDTAVAKEDEKTKTTKYIDSFKDELTTLGASAFVQKLNLEKIEKLIEDKRSELTKSLGLSEDSNPVLQGEDRKTALATLEKMLNEYTKELQAQMQIKNLQTKNNEMLSSVLKNF
ncbi:MAG: hypothetical protein PHW07_04535 [Sulfurospirillaceae bacterium]|nr:hypothetical protein [Sulfurospirillaceae bacterium]